MNRTCRYSDLKVGENAVINTKECKCGNCGHVFGFVRFVEYLGHNRGLDGFRLVNPVHCPECNAEIAIYAVPCVNNKLEV